MQRTPDQLKQLKHLAYFWSEADEAVLNLSKTRYPQNLPQFPLGIEYASQGLLDRLPLEISQMILEYLDLESLGRLRRVNARGRVIVDSIASYRNLMTYCQGALQGLAAVKLLGKHTAQDLYSVACQDRCQFCGCFGSFFYMPQCRRVCIFCLEYHGGLELLPLSTADVKILFGLSDESLEHFSIASTVAGTYGFRRTEDPAHRLIDYREASDRCKRLYQGQGAIEARKGSYCFRPEMYTGRREFSFMVSTPLPYLDMDRRRVENGLWCRGCKYYYDTEMTSIKSLKRANKTYSEEEILAHFEECTVTKMLWTKYIRKGLPVSYSKLSKWTWSI